MCKDAYCTHPQLLDQVFMDLTYDVLRSLGVLDGMAPQIAACSPTAKANKGPTENPAFFCKPVFAV